LKTSLFKEVPSKNDILNAITQYNFLVKTLESVLSSIEINNINKRTWTIYSEKIGRKFLTQAYTLQRILEEDIYFIKDGKERKIFDVSTTATILRMQLESFSVLYHLFIDSCEREEKMLRFRLWQLDGLQTRQKYLVPKDTPLSNKLEQEQIEILEVINSINQLPYFLNLNDETKDYLVRTATWRFTDETLKNKDRNKRRLSIEQMAVRTGINLSIFSDFYEFISTHTHSTYWSVVQSDSLNEEELIISEYVTIFDAAYITSFVISDFCKIYNTAKEVFDSLKTTEKEIINTLNRNGRHK
jgi:hypothetical protein